jgi:hypothetical protein
MPSEHTDTTRRRLLKSIGATSLALGATGVTSAAEVPTTELKRVEAAHADATRARWAAAQHADPVLSELSRRGVLERGSVTELDFEGVEAKGVQKDGTVLAHVETTTEFEDATVEFAARPQTGRVYATVRADGDVYTVESAAGTDDVTTQGCYYEHDCTNYACDGGGCVYLERECCNYGDGYECGDWYQDGCCTC